MVSQSKYGYIGYCAGCDRYNLVFNNIFLLLKKVELKGLGEITDKSLGVWFMDSAIGGGKQVSMQTPLPNVYFAFSAPEYEEFKRLINEAVLILNANQIIQHKN